MRRQKEFFTPRLQKTKKMKLNFHDELPSFYLSLTDSEIANRYGKQAIKEINAIRQYLNNKDNHTQIKSSREAAKLIRHFCAFSSVEKFCVVYLNNANKVIQAEIASTGTQTACLVSIPMICKTALLLNARSVIVGHNHPSGNKKPSEADITIVKKLSAALSTLELTLLDSLIVTPEDCLSFADEGLI